MWIRKITNQNLIEIIVLPIIFILLIIAGFSVLLFYNIGNQVIFASWCVVVNVIMLLLVAAYTYWMLKKKME